jgi:chromosome segregation ATPase
MALHMTFSSGLLPLLLLLAVLLPACRPDTRRAEAELSVLDKEWALAGAEFQRWESRLQEAAVTHGAAMSELRLSGLQRQAVRPEQLPLLDSLTRNAEAYTLRFRSLEAETREAGQRWAAGAAQLAELQQQLGRFRPDLGDIRAGLDSLKSTLAGLRSSLQAWPARLDEIQTGARAAQNTLRPLVQAAVQPAPARRRPAATPDPQPAQ